MWSARGNDRLQITYVTAGELLAKLASGEPADVVILPSDALMTIEKKGIVSSDSRRDLGAVSIGVAVKEGAKLPDLSSEDGLKRALLDAKSVTYMDPTRGTSGKYFDEVVLPKLGIREQVRAKTVLGDGGMVAEKVARGEVEMAIQQMTELLPVAGISIVGNLPPSLQKTTVYSGATTTASASPREAAGLLAFLGSKEARAVFVSKGFTDP
jgi:molybdate transport system substrate-binding protein